MNNKLIISLLIITVMNCKNPTIVLKEIEVTDSTPVDGCSTCYFSIYDNPKLTGVDILNDFEDKEEPAFESTMVNTDGYYFQDFDAQITTMGNQSLGASSANKIFVKPTTPNATIIQAVNPYSWEARGIELGYDWTDAFLAHTNAWGDTYRKPTNPIRIRLKPEVILVPIQIVRVLLDDSYKNEYSYTRLNQLTKYSYKYLFDDFAYFQRQSTTSPYKQISNMKYIENSGGVIYNGAKSELSDYIQPDLIWAKCGIQFRLIKVFDLIVNDIKRIRPESCESGSGAFIEYSTMKNLLSDAKNIPGINTDLPIILSVFAPSGKCVGSVPVDVAGEDWCTLALDYRPKYGLAHELGHILGLNDNTNCSFSAKKLMCTVTGFQSDVILDWECQEARAKAIKYSNLYFGMPMAPK